MQTHEKPAEIRQDEKTAQDRKLALMAAEAMTESDRNWVLAAELTTQVREREAYRAAGFTTWAEYCESRKGLNVSVGHANSRIRVYAQLAAKMHPDEIVAIGLKRAMAIGPHLENGGNAVELIRKARTLNGKEWEAFAATLRAGGEGKDGLTRKSFAFQPDAWQIVGGAIERVKQSDEGEMSDSRALELICADFMAGAA
jgi:hypothetical protein